MGNKIKKSDIKMQEILEFIKNYSCKFGYPPNVREIGESVGFSSTSTVVYYLEKLEKNGLIKRNNSKNRAIEIVNYESKRNNYSASMLTIPILGQVAGGQPILAEENKEDVFEVSKNFFGTNADLFSLKVKGDSMIDCGIANGDLIVVKMQNIANNGDIVVAQTEDGTTVKKFYKENGYFRLQPQNDNFEPIIVNNVNILGKVIACIKKF